MVSVFPTPVEKLLRPVIKRAHFLTGYIGNTPPALTKISLWSLHQPHGVRPGGETPAPEQHLELAVNVRPVPTASCSTRLPLPAACPRSRCHRRRCHRVYSNCATRPTRNFAGLNFIEAAI